MASASARVQNRRRDETAEVPGDRCTGRQYHACVGWTGARRTTHVEVHRLGSPTQVPGRARVALVMRHVILRLVIRYGLYRRSRG